MGNWLENRRMKKKEEITNPLYGVPFDVLLRSTAVTKHKTQKQISEEAKEKRQQGWKWIYLDIMVDDKFYQQLPMKYCPLFPIEYEDMVKFVLDRLPSLKNKNFTINFSNNKVK